MPNLFFLRNKYGKKLAKNLYQAEPNGEKIEKKTSFVKREVKHCSGLKIANSERTFSWGSYNFNGEFAVAGEFISKEEDG